MMKHKQTHKIIALLLVFLLALGFAPMGFAAESDETTPRIIYKGKSAVDRWLFQNVDTTYTPTDLFANYKNVMPGDTLVRDFVVKNESKNRIKLYMEIIPHDGVQNKLSQGVAQHTTTEQVVAFLNQLSLIVTAEEGETSTVLFAIPEGALGTYEGKAALGTIYSGYGAELQVALHIPITLGNAYALDLTNGTGIGELDFCFTIEEYEPGGGGGGSNPDKDSDKDPEDVPPVIPGGPTEDIEDPEIPNDLPPVPDMPLTGDTSDILTPVLLMLFAGLGLLWLLKKRND